MNKSIFKTVLLWALVVILSSCSAIMSSMYGVKRIKRFDQQNYDNFIAKAKEYTDFVAIVSTHDQYRQLINLGKDSVEKKDFGQPVQMLYFENGILASYHINCYAKGGVSNINWNTDNRFSSFLPQTAVKHSIGDMKLSDYTKIYPELASSSDKPYTILIFWTNMLPKISLSAIKTVADNIKVNNKDSDCRIFLINTDNFFARYM